MADENQDQSPKSNNSIVGTYQHEKNENLDEYFAAVGVPYIPRKMMLMSRPTLEISTDGEKWKIKTVTMLRTVEINFKLDEDYEEHMPGNTVLKSLTTLEDGKLVTRSQAPDGSEVKRTYECNENGCVLTMEHEKSQNVAKRYFIKVK